MNTPLSRRTALRAAGATAPTAGLSGRLTATTARAADGTASGGPSKPSWYLTTDTVQWFADEHVTDLRFLTTAEAEAVAAS
jgi:hypothetical protein